MPSSRDVHQASGLASAAGTTQVAPVQKPLTDGAQRRPNTRPGQPFSSTELRGLLEPAAASHNGDQTMIVLSSLPMESLRVPKRRLVAEAMLANGSRLTVALYLSGNCPKHTGAERLSDLLTNAPRFLPADDLASGRTCFLGRDALYALRVPASAEVGGAAETELPVEHEVEVLLSNGERLTGAVSYVRPPESSRLLDFLSSDEPYLRLYDGDDVVFINKHHVALVTPTDC